MGTAIAGRYITAMTKIGKGEKNEIDK